MTTFSSVPRVKPNFRSAHAAGIEYVIVNGTPVLERGKHTKKRAGRVLRHRA